MKKTNSLKNKRQPADIFDRADTAVTLIAISAVIAPYMYTVTFFNFKYSAVLSFGLVLAAVFTGYGLQWISGRIAGIRRSADNNAYDSYEKFFKPHQAIFSIMIAVITGIITGSAFMNYLKYRAESGTDGLFDKYTMIPYEIAALTAVSMIIGTVIWFYPFGRIISVKTVIPFTAVLFINFALTFFYGGVTQAFATFCLLLYISCSFILLNQSNILRTFRTTGTVKITSSVRLYNLALIIIIIALLAAVLIVTISFTVGITALFKIALFFMLSSFINEGEVPDNTSEVVKSFNDSVFSRLIDSSDVSGNISKIFFFIFLIISTGIILFFIINRRRETWFIIKKFFSELFNGFIDFLLSILNARKTAEDNYTILDYRDEELKMDENAVKEYNPYKSTKKNNFRNFMSRIGNIPDEADKLKYAYSELTQYWKNENYGISISDTPREIREKVDYKINESELPDITEVFEFIKYAEMNPGPDRLKNAVDSVCRLMQRYLD